MRSSRRVMLGLAALAIGGFVMGCQQQARGTLNRIHFDFDRSDVKADYQDEMQKNAAWAQSHPSASVVVEGHCDERGSTEYNIALGDRRAKSAKAYLQHLGVSGAKISTISYGEERPLCTQHDEGCWWKNRRAEFVAR
ncbi:MAG: peptidoglycan-associated lipoprotein Pal [Deltaproteobacteria bacterium]|nr:peptidoglycan-associated lipoprotein Pal [Deltaproteobacteria bacterium]